jgi:hypothetical protein
MCDGEPLLVIYYLLGLILYALIPFHFSSFYVCDSRKIGVCEVKEESYICVKNKYNGFQLKIK